MNESGNPRRSSASGCFACPHAPAADLDWGGASPYPGFSDPNGAYYSIGLTAGYFPYATWRDEGNCIVTPFPPSDAEMFLAVALHEVNGHYAIDSVSKNLVRHLIAQSYQSIWHLMQGPDTNAWTSLQRYNRYIALTESIEMTEELYATLLGVRSLRSRQCFDRGSVDRIEEQFVAANSRDDKFGNQFREFYSQLGEIYDEVHDLAYPDDVVGTIVNYSQSCFGLRSFQLEQDIVFDVRLEHLSEESVLSRLRTSMKAIAELLGGKQDLKAWTVDDWGKYLGKHLPDAGGFAWAHGEVERFIELSFEAARRRPMGLGPAKAHTFNPVAGMLFFAEGDTQAFIAQDVAAFHPAHSAWMAAHGRGDALLVVGPRASHALFFTPAKALRPGTVLPFPHVRRARDAKRGDLDDIEVRLNMQAAMLYEAMRQQIAVGEGPVCPVAPLMEGRCCGMKPLIQQLWESVGTLVASVGPPMENIESRDPCRMG